MTKLSVGFAMVISKDHLKEIDSGFCVGTPDGKIFAPSIIINNTDSENLKKQLHGMIDRLISTSDEENNNE